MVRVLAEIMGCCSVFVLLSAGCGSGGGVDAAVADLATEQDQAMPNDMAVADLAGMDADLSGADASLDLAGDLAGFDLAGVDPCMLLSSGNGISVMNATAMPNNVQYASTAPLGPSSVHAVAKSLDIYFTVPFDQTEAGVLANYVITPSLDITMVTVKAAQQTVTLTTADQVPDQAYTITISNIHDSTGTTLFAPASLPFSGYRFHMVPQSYAPKIVGIYFYESKVPCAAAQDTASYSIPGYTVMSAVGSGCGSLTSYVTLTLDRGLSPGPHTITASAALTDTLGNPLPHLTETFYGPGNPAPLYVPFDSVSASSVDLTFSTDVDPTTAAVAGNYTLNPALAIGTPIVGAGANGNVVSLPVSTAANVLYTLSTAGVLVKGGASATIPDHYFFGAGSFYLSGGLGMTPTKIRISFSEDVGASASVASNYAVSGGATVQSVSSVGAVAYLTLTGAQPGTDYYVTATGISSVGGVPLSTAFGGTVDVKLSAAVDTASLPVGYLGNVEVTREYAPDVARDGQHLFLYTGPLPSGSYQLKLCGIKDAAHTTVIGSTTVDFDVP